MILSRNYAAGLVLLYIGIVCYRFEAHDLVIAIPMILGACCLSTLGNDLAIAQVDRISRKPQLLALALLVPVAVLAWLPV